MASPCAPQRRRLELAKHFGQPALKDATSFNAFLRRTIVRISEVHDLGPARFQFFDVTKDWHAAPPETLTVADKHVKAYEIMTSST